MTFLLVDDDTRLAKMLQTFFAQHDLSCAHAETLGEARAMLAANTFAACILDVNLPDGDGMSFCEELRAQPATKRLPILMFTARGDTLDKVLGLELGADDYLSKPFEPSELLARTKALLRRSQFNAIDEAHAIPCDEVLQFEHVHIDLRTRTVMCGDQRVDISSHQFNLLVVLAKRAGHVLSRDQIMQALSGHDLEAFDRSIDVHISRIRAALEDDPKKPKLIQTVRQVGYVFTDKPKVAL